MMNEVLEERGDPEFSLIMPCFNEEAIVSHTNFIQQIRRKVVELRYGK